jgi:hypothetical protein
MPEYEPVILPQYDAFLIILLSVTVLVFLTAYYFIRKSLLQSEDFDSKVLRSLTREDKQEGLSYCISFFQDAYDSRELPDMSLFMEFRLKTIIVITFYKSIKKASFIYIKLKNHYYKDKPLPDLTDRYKEQLKSDGRDGSDVMSAFCLFGIEEYSKGLEE